MSDRGQLTRNEDWGREARKGRKAGVGGRLSGGYRGNGGEDVKGGQWTNKVYMVFSVEEAKEHGGQGTEGKGWGNRGHGTSSNSTGWTKDGGRGMDKGGGKDRRCDSVSDALLVFSNSDVKGTDARGGGRRTKIGRAVVVHRVSKIVVCVVRHWTAVD